MCHACHVLVTFFAHTFGVGMGLHDVLTFPHPLLQEATRLKYTTAASSLESAVMVLSHATFTGCIVANVSGQVAKSVQHLLNAAAKSHPCSNPGSSQPGLSSSICQAKPTSKKRGKGKAATGSSVENIEHQPAAVISATEVAASHIVKLDDSGLQSLAYQLHAAAAKLKQHAMHAEASTLLQAAFDCSMQRARQQLQEGRLFSESPGTTHSTAQSFVAGALKHAKNCLNSLWKLASDADCSPAAGNSSSQAANPAADIVKLVQVAAHIVLDCLDLARSTSLPAHMQQMKALLKLHAMLVCLSSKAEPAAGSQKPARRKARLTSMKHQGQPSPQAAQQPRPKWITEQLVEQRHPGVLCQADIIALCESQTLIQLGSHGRIASQQCAHGKACLLACLQAITPEGWTDTAWSAQVQLLTVLVGLYGDGDQAVKHLQAGIDGFGALDVTKHAPKTPQPSVNQQPSHSRDVIISSAALTHCLLGLCLANQQLKQAADAAASKTADESDGDCNSEAARTTGVASSSATADNPFKRTSKRQTGRSKETQSAKTDTQATPFAWSSIHAHLRDGVSLWLSCVSCVGVHTIKAGNTLGVMPPHVLRYPEVVMDAALQAWHLAGLQGWHQLQQQYSHVLATSLGSLTQSHLQKLQPLLHSMSLCSASAAVLTPQLPFSIGSLAFNGLGRDSGCAATNDSSQASSNMQATSMCTGLHSIEECRQKHQELHAAADQLAQSGHLKDHSTMLQLASINLAAATAALQAGDVVASFVDAEAALHLSGKLHALQNQPTAAQPMQVDGPGQGDSIHTDIDDDHNHIVNGFDSEAVEDDLHTADTSDGLAEQTTADLSTLNHASYDSTAASAPAIRGSYCSLPSVQGTVLGWQAVYLYLSSLWMMSKLYEISGSPTDAITRLREAVRLAEVMHACPSSVMCHAALAVIYSKQSDCNKAQTHAQSAECWLARWQHDTGDTEQKLSGSADGVVTLVMASVLYAKGTLSCSRSEWHDAEKQFAAAAECLQSTFSTLADDTVDTSSGGGSLQWQLVDLQAHAQLGCACCLEQQGSKEEAVGVLSEAVHCLEAGSTR